MNDVVLQGKRCRLRAYQMADLEGLVLQANNVNVWINMMDLFPNPYSIEDGRKWISECLDDTPPLKHFAVEAEERFAGGISIAPRGDVYHRVLTIGYWLGEEFWGRGIMTEACGMIVDYSIGAFNPVRIEAEVFAWNHRSTRVLAKNGLRLEARLEARIEKAGRITDELIYSKILHAEQAKFNSDRLARNDEADQSPPTSGARTLPTE